MGETIQRLPQTGEVWSHNNKGKYIVIVVTNTWATDHTKWPVTVVYEDIFKNIWSRPVHEFLSKFTRLNSN